MENLGIVVTVAVLLRAAPSRSLWSEGEEEDLKAQADVSPGRRRPPASFPARLGARDRHCTAAMDTAFEFNVLLCVCVF